MLTALATGGRTVTRPTLQSSAPGTWDTDAATPAWVLGAASTLDAPLLLNDPVTMAVNFQVADGASFHLFAADYADIEFVPGTTLTVTATFSDGTTSSSSRVSPSRSPRSLLGRLEHDRNGDRPVGPPAGV